MVYDNIMRQNVFRFIGTEDVKSIMDLYRKLSAYQYWGMLRWCFNNENELVGYFVRYNYGKKD